jgi:hypothetical protein
MRGGLRAAYSIRMRSSLSLSLALRRMESMFSVGFLGQVRNSNFTLKITTHCPLTRD